MNSEPLDIRTIVYYESKICYMNKYFKACKNISTLSKSTEAKKKKRQKTIKKKGNLKISGYGKSSKIC